MKGFINLVFLVAFLSTCAYSGRIYPWGEPRLTYPNKGQLKTLDLFFSLENPLPTGHVLKLTLPFGGTVSLTNTQIWQVTTSRGATPVSAPATGIISQSAIYQPTSGTVNPIYLRYGSDLSANTTYLLRVTFSASPADNAGFLGWIQLETLSPALSTASASATDIPITYDQNLAFAPLHWLPAPGNPTFSTTTTDVNNGTAAAVYLRQFKFQLTQDFWLWPIIQITWDNPAFVFSNCLNLDTGVSSTTQTPLSTSLYTCSFASSTTAGTATILYNAPIAKSQVVTFQFTLTNPTPNTALGANTNINLLVMHRYNQNLTDITVSPISLSVQAPAAVPAVAGSCALTDPRIILSWGIDRALFTNNAHLRIFRIATCTTAQPFYQTQKFQFMVNSTIPTGNYIFTVGICNKNAAAAGQFCDVLENSIAHNFGSGVQCTWTAPAQTTTNGFMACTGITSLSPQNKYFVAARVLIIMDAATINPATAFQTIPNTGTIADSYYGQMTLTQASGGATVCTATRPDANTYLQANGLTQRPNFQRYGTLVGHTTAADWTSYQGVAAYAAPALTPPITSGIYANTNDSTVYLGFVSANPSQLAFTGSTRNIFNDIVNVVPRYAGIDLFLNPALFSINSGFSPSRCSIRTAPTVASGVAAPNNTGAALHCYGTYYAGNGSSYTRLRQIVVTAGLNIPGACGFYWEEFVITPAYTGASLGAEGGSGDYYAAFYALGSITPAVSPNATNVSSSNGATDIGELGTMGTSDGITVSTFWSQYIYSPVSQVFPSTAFSYIIQNNVLAADLLTSSNAMTFMKIRFSFNSSLLPTGISGNMSFLYGQTYQALQPSTATTNTYGQTRCIYWGQTSTCMNARPGRLYTAAASQNTLNSIERLGILITPIQVQSLPANTTVTGVIVVPIGAASTVSNNFGGRFMIYNPTTGWFWLQNTNGAQLAASVPPATVLPTIAICTNSSTTNGIRLLTSPSDVANTQIATQTLWIASNKVYTAGVASQTFLGVFAWCAGWNWQTASTTLGNTQKYYASAWNESCALFDYSYTPTGTTTPVSFWCIYCPVNDTSSPGNDSITINNFKTASAVDVLQPTYYTISKAATADVLEVGYCSQIQSLYQPGLANVIAANGTGYGIQGQKATFIVTAGSTWSGITRVLLTGRTNATSSAVFDTNFPYGTYDTSGACFMVPSSQLGLYANYISCTAAILQGYIQITFSALSAANAAIQTWAFVLYGFNPNQAAGSSSTIPTPNISYFIAQTQTGNSYSIVDQSPIASWTLPNFTNAIYLADVRYERAYLNAKGYFKWDFFFPAQRNMYFNDQLVFYLDAISNNQSNINSNVVKCRITDQYDVLLQAFRSCTLNGAIYPATLTLVPWGTTTVFEFSVPKSIRVYLDNIQTIALQTVKTIYGRLIFQGAATTPGQTISLIRTNTATDQQLSAIVTPNVFATLQTVQQLWKVSQSVQDLSFNISLNIDSYTSNSRISVVFPSYYHVGLTVRSALPYCTVDGILTYCYVVSPRTLRVEGFNGVRAANTSFILKVQGVPAPVGNYSLENFWVQVNNATDDSASTLSTAGVMTDVAFVDVTLSPIHVTWHYLVGTSTRSTSTFNWVFTLLNNAAVNTTKTFQVIFPDSWSLGVGASAPSCRVYDYIVQSVNYASQLSTSGNQVNLNFTANVPVNASLNLECVNVRTPDSENATYPNQDIIIRVGEANGTLLYYHSAPSVHNVNYSLTFTKNQGQYLDWTFPAGQPTVNNVSVISITRGTFSTPLNAWVVGRTARNFSISPSTTNFGFYPSPFNISTGYDNQTALFGCDVSVPVNNYFVQFTLSDTSTYTVPSNLFVQVTNTLVPIVVTPSVVTTVTTIQPVSGTARTNPVVFDVSANPPYTSITITPTFPTGTQNFTVSPASLTLTAASPRGSFVYSSIAGVPAGAFSAVTYNISGPNAAAYQTLASQTVQLLADVNNQASVKPSLIILDDQTSSIRNSTWRLLNFTLIGVDSATIYYVVGISGSISLDGQGIISNALLMPAFNASSANQAQFGIFTHTQSPSKFPQNFNVSNLIPGLTYEIRAIASSLTNQNSSVYSYQFQTTQNAAMIYRYLFNYQTYPTRQQRQTLLCSLAQILQVPNMKVVGINGDSCGVAPWNSYTNTSNQIAVYFYPLNVEFDSATRIPSALSNVTIFSQITTAVGADNATVLNSTAADGTEINQQVVLNLPPAPAIGQNWLGLMNLTLNTPGFIFYSLSNTSLALPLAQNLRNVGTQNGFSYYHPTLGSVTLNFTSLTPGVTYTLYIAASNNDPSVFANFTAVSSFQIALQAPTTIIASSATAMVVPFILAALLSVIALMV